MRHKQLDMALFWMALQTSAWRGAHRWGVAVSCEAHNLVSWLKDLNFFLKKITKGTVRLETPRVGIACVCMPHTHTYLYLFTHSVFQCVCVDAYACVVEMRSGCL
eukprot:GHVR01043657.1.p1 GENE.GHVR01043657.1~~GHVR01043657.1.p1  ORF type:complete len:105 (-),score=24.68 GHVR01043657.1:120-434(-)